MNIKVGTRGSKLALIQTYWIIDKIKEKYPEVNFEVKEIKTTGDRIQHLSLDKIGDKGLFVKEIEQQLLDGEIDIAVHSMKDMPSSLPEGLKFTRTPKREDPRDVLILKEGFKSLDELPEGAKIGTGSKRRKYQLLNERPDLEVVSIRGNIETRIKKIESENLHGVVLAAAGIIRAGLEDVVSEFIPVDTMVPAPAQGALAIEIRDNNSEIEGMLNTLGDEVTDIQISAERGFLDGVNGSCHIPIGAFCEVEGSKLKLTGIYGDEEGQCLIKHSMTGVSSSPRELGLDLAKKVLEEYNRYEG